MCEVCGVVPLVPVVPVTQKGLALTIYERNDPHPIEYVNHVPRLVVETTTTAPTTTALMVPLLEPLHNEVSATPDVSVEQTFKKLILYL